MRAVGQIVLSTLLVNIGVNCTSEACLTRQTIFVFALNLHSTTNADKAKLQQRQQKLTMKIATTRN